MDGERLFLDNLPLIDRIVAATCRRNRMTREEGEDFASTIRLKLIADDYAVLRAYTGKNGCTLAGYLTVAVQRTLLDQRNHQWGKWRPCMEARRLGPLAVKLDSLMNRDGLTLDEACARASPEDRDEMRGLAERLPVRSRRRGEGEAAALSPRGAIAEENPEGHLLTQEREETRGRLLRALGEAIERLPDEDRLLVRLRLDHRTTLASMAPALGYEVKQLYRRWEALLRELRATLERSGYDAEQAAWALETESPASWPAPARTAGSPSIGVGQSP
jgi:RNA polymerase sigma factor (sigma-70 family)